MNKLLNTINKLFNMKSSLSLIDIGARWGLQRPWNRFPKKHLKYCGFDADSVECKRLNDLNGDNDSVVYINAALSDEKSSATLYLTDEEGCSSIFKPNYKYINRYHYKDNWRLKKEIHLETTTLRACFDEFKIKPDFIKIDTQGAELKILNGAGDYLNEVLGLELEIEFIPLYKDQPLFSDIDPILRKKGFELYDLNRYWANRVNMGRCASNRGQIVFCDAIYFRSVESFYSMKFIDEKEKRSKLFKMISVLALYGFFDVAINFIRNEESKLSKKECEELESVLYEMSCYPKWQKLIFNNKCANKLGRLFHFVGNMFAYKQKTFGWGTDYNAVDGRYMYHSSSKIGKRFMK